MKRYFFAILVIHILCSSVKAQQWNGSSTSSDNIYRDGDLTVVDNSIARVSLGAAWGGKPIWGRGYIGFNLRRENTGLWSYLTDGARNDGVAIYTSGDNLMFSLKPSSGAFSAANFSDADVVDNVLFCINSSTNAFTFGRNNIQTVSIGPAWGNRMWGEGYIGFNLERNDVGTWDYKSDGANNGSFVIWAGAGGELNFSPKASSGGSSGTWSDADVVSNRIFQIRSDGKIAIGDISSLNISTNYHYGLYVEHGILTERVRVALKSSADWADYVFDKNYKLMSLNEVASYIGKNKHLPDVPAAEDVVKQGIDVASMNALLLKKIEELTVYAIKQQEEIEAMKKEMKKK